MRNLLKELYYQNNSRKNISEEEKELIRLMEINRTKLEASLNDEQKNRLEKLIDCYDEFYSISYREEFIQGVSLGGRIIMEMLFGNLSQ